jgi:hypothetical protein
MRCCKEEHRTAEIQAEQRAKGLRRMWRKWVDSGARQSVPLAQ